MCNLTQILYWHNELTIKRFVLRFRNRARTDFTRAKPFVNIVFLFLFRSVTRYRDNTGKLKRVRARQSGTRPKTDDTAARSALNSPGRWAAVCARQSRRPDSRPVPFPRRWPRPLFWQDCAPRVCPCTRTASRKCAGFLLRTGWKQKSSVVSVFTRTRALDKGRIRGTGETKIIRREIVNAFSDVNLIDRRRTDLVSKSRWIIPSHRHDNSVNFQRCEQNTAYYKTEVERILGQECKDVSF